MSQKELDYMEGYRLAIQNAKEFIEMAEATKHICYGKANSLLILASEEAVKACMLKVRFNEPKRKIPGFDKYFREHRHKHEMINTLEKIAEMFDIGLEILQQPVQNAYKEKGELTEQEVQQYGEEGISNLFDLLQQLSDGETTMTKVIQSYGREVRDDWWSKADQEKMRGFYVDRNVGKTSWFSPAQITEEEYTKSFEIVTHFVKLFDQDDEAMEE